jgi:hypothetical protein
MDMVLYALLNKRIKTMSSSIKTITIDENNHLIVILSNDTRIDAGALPTGDQTAAITNEAIDKIFSEI